MKRTLFVLLVVSLLGACGSRVRDWPDNAIGQPVVRTDAATNDDTDEDGVADPDDEADRETTETTGVTPGGPATTIRRSTSATTPVASPLPHPQPGSYTYDVTTDVPAFEGEPASRDTDTYKERWTATEESGGLRLTSTGGDDEDPLITTYRLTASALEYVSDEYDDEDDPYRCVYKPAQTILKLPLRVGATWHTDSTCTYEDGESDRVVFDSRVTGTATDTVGGKAVSTFVIEWVDTTTVSYPADPEEDIEAGSETFRTQHTAHVDPNTLLIVSEVAKDISEDGLGFTFTRKLRSLTPR